MGNKYCYATGQKHKTLLDNYLNLPFSADRRQRDHLLSDYFDFLEMNPSRVEFAADYIKSKISSRRDALGNRVITKPQFDLILNGIQLMGFILSWMKVTDDLYDMKSAGRPTLERKTTLGKSLVQIGFKGAIKKESSLISRFLNFQSLSFKTFERSVDSDYNFAIPGDEGMWHIALILRGWSEVFKKWDLLESSSFDQSVVNFLKMSLAHAQRFLPARPIQEGLNDMYSALPLFLYEKAKSDVRLPIEVMLQSIYRPGGPDMRRPGCEVLTALLSRLSTLAQEQQILEALDYFSEKDSKLLVELTQFSSLEIEQSLFAILSLRIAKNPTEVPLMISFFERSSPKMLTNTNANMLAGFMCLILADSSKSPAEKQQLFETMMRKAGAKQEIGHIGLLRPMLLRIKQDTKLFPAFSAHLLAYLRTDHWLDSSDPLEASFTQLCFELLPVHPPFIECIFLMIFRRRNVSSAFAFSSDLKEMLDGTKNALYHSVTRADAYSPLYWFYSTKIFLTLLETESKPSFLSLQADPISTLLSAPPSLASFLTSVLLCFHFGKNYSVSQEITTIIDKYDDLFSLPHIKLALDLIEEEQHDQRVFSAFQAIIRDQSFSTRVSSKDYETLKEYFLLQSRNGLNNNNSLSLSAAFNFDEFGRGVSLPPTIFKESSLFQDNDKRNLATLSTTEILKRNLERNEQIIGLNQKIF